MGYYKSFKAYAEKFRELGKTNGVIAEAVKRAGTKAATRMERESKGVLSRDIYSRYIPSKAEYRKSVTKGDVKTINAAHKQAGHPGQKGQQDRAWQRSGELLAHEKGFVEIDRSTGEIKIGLRNDASNRRGSRYGVPRMNLGMAGRRRNSRWTKSTQWQLKTVKRRQAETNDYITKELARALER